jgi:hypothetical protein
MIRTIKKYSAKSGTATQGESVIARESARRAARKAAEALVAAKKASMREGEGEQIEDINIDADTASVIYSDKDANVQVVVGEDPDGGITVAVVTAEHDNLEEEEVLTSVTVGEGEAPAAEGGNEPETTEEAKKAAAVEEARKAIRGRLQR